MSLPHRESVPSDPFSVARHPVRSIKTCVNFKVKWPCRLSPTVKLPKASRRDLMPLMDGCQR